MIDFRCTIQKRILISRIKWYRMKRIDEIKFCSLNLPILSVDTLHFCFWDLRNKHWRFTTATICGDLLRVLVFAYIARHFTVHIHDTKTYNLIDHLVFFICLELLFCTKSIVSKSGMHILHAMSSLKVICYIEAYNLHNKSFQIHIANLISYRWKFYDILIAGT